MTQRAAATAGSVAALTSAPVAASTLSKKSTTKAAKTDKGGYVPQAGACQ